MDRIRALETALKEAKEGALKDRKRYKSLVIFGHLSFNSISWFNRPIKQWK